jgi:UDP-glucose:(heptosyl)LPS alpha-1,3-glucosyltransferase
VRRRWVADGGGERFTMLLGAGLAKAGCSVTVVSSAWAPVAGLDACRIPVLDRGEFHSLLSFTINAHRHLRRAGYDLVQSHEKLLWQDVYRAGNGCHREWLRQRFRYHPSARRYLVRLAPHHRLVLALERNLLVRRRYRVIVANAARVGEDLVRNYNVPREHIRVIHNAVDVDRFHPDCRARRRAAARQRFGLPDRAVVALFMGTGFERKGLAYLLRALPEAGGDVHALVVGRDERAADYVALADALGVSPHVRFTGTLPDPEEAYGAADIFVLPTIYEPFSNACLEALACGLPVVTSRVNGASEILTGGLAALTLDEPSDHAVLAARLRGLCDPDLREELGAEGRAVAETRPLDRAVGEFMAVYRTLGLG